MPVKQYGKIAKIANAIIYTGVNGKQIKAWFAEHYPNHKVRIGPNWIKITNGINYLIRDVTISNVGAMIVAEGVISPLYLITEDSRERYKRRGRTRKDGSVRVYVPEHWVEAIQLRKNAKEVADFIRNRYFGEVRAGGNWVYFGERVILNGDWFVYRPGHKVLGPVKFDVISEYAFPKSYYEIVEPA